MSNETTASASASAGTSSGTTKSTTKSASNKRLFRDTVHRIVNRLIGVDVVKTNTKANSSTGTNTLRDEDLTCLLRLSLCFSVNDMKDDSNDSNIDDNDDPTNDDNFNDDLMILVERLEQPVIAASQVFPLEQALRHSFQKYPQAPSQATQAFRQWIQQDLPIQLQLLQRGLHAAQIILCIASTKGVDPRAVNEDAIASAIALARIHLLKNLIPSLQNQTETVQVHSTTNNNDHPPTIITSNKRQRTGTSNTTSTSTNGSNSISSSVCAKELKKLYHLLLAATMDPFLALTERLEQLLRVLPLDDAPILMLTSSMLRTLELQGDTSTTTTKQQHQQPRHHSLQLAALSLLTAAFQRYPTHRSTIWEDLLVLLPKLLPHQQRRATGGDITTRTFPISYASLPFPIRFQQQQHQQQKQQHQQQHPSPKPCIQMLTALILQFLLATVERPTYTYVDDTHDDTKQQQHKQQHEEKGDEKNVKTGKKKDKSNDNNNNKLLVYQSGLKACHGWANVFAAKLVQRCLQKSASSSSSGSSGGLDYRPLLSFLLEDLLSIWMIPEYSVAEVLLVALMRRLMHDIMLQSAAASTTSTAITSPTLTSPSLETTYLNAAFDQLGRMAAAQARLRADYRTKALHPSSNATSSSSLSDSKESQNQQIQVQAPLSSSSALVVVCRLGCYCCSKSDEPFCLACDVCGTCFHGPCVGLTNRYSLPEEWKCDSCKLANILQMVKNNNYNNNNNNNNDPSTVVNSKSKGRKQGPSDGGGDLSDDACCFLYDEAFALQHAYLLQLVRREQGGGGGLPLQVLPSKKLRQVTRFQVARWADRLAAAAASGKTSLDRSNHHDNNNNDGTSNNEATAIRATQTVVSRLLDKFWDGSDSEKRSLLVVVAPEEKEAFSEEGSNRLILSCMATSSPFLLSFQSQIMKNLIRLLEDEKNHALRKLSLKAIEKAIEGDPELMLKPSIISAVSRRLSDDQISVREAALSLVGSYVVKSPDVASSFQEALLLRLADAGVSVRKRCVRIFQDILMVEPRFQGRSEVCSALLQRATDPKEEDGVRDLIHDLFLKLWLQDGDVLLSPESAHKSNTVEKDDSSPPVPSNASALGCVVTPTPKPEIGEILSAPVVKKAPQTRAYVAAEQMVEVVRGAGSAEYLETLLRELLQGAADNDKGRKQAERNKRAELARNQCDRLVSSLFELLLSMEERRPLRPEGQMWAKDLAAVLQSISMFAELSPNAVLRRLDTVLPYLKADNAVPRADEQTIVTPVCDILFRLTTTCGPETASQAAHVSADLQLVTYKYSPSTMEAAIRALSSLAVHQEAAGKGDFDTKLLQLTQQFYKYLVSKKDVEDFADEKIRSNAHRALTALGFVCEYRKDKVNAVEWEDEVANDYTVLIASKEFKWENSLLACYRIFRCYLDKKDLRTKCSALHALAGMFVSQPRLMLVLEQDQLIHDVMSDEAHVSLQLVALQCWRRILLGEEKRIDGGKAKEKMDCDRDITTVKRISGDQDGDASLFGGILTNHAARLFEMTQTGNFQVRYASLDLIGVLLKQGQLNPNDAVPYLFALQGDSESIKIRSLALQLLMREGEKRPDMLRQRICAGVKKAYEFQRAVYPNKEVSSLIQVRQGNVVTTECVFSNVFKECVVKHRKQRHGLYTNLLSLFDVSEVVDDESPRPAARCKRVPHKPKKSTDVDLLCFASQILAHLPYEASGDPLFIIHKITMAIELQGSQIENRLASLLRPVGLASSDELDDINSGEDALERAARVKFPSRTEEAKKLSSPEFDLEAFTAVCRDSAALTLLLRLKSFLRQLYNLNEIRCIEYDPNAKESIVDRGISKSVSTKAFDSTIRVPRSNTSIPQYQNDNKRVSTINMDELIRHYAEFRRLMRAELAVPSDGTRAGAGAGIAGGDEEDMMVDDKKDGDACGEQQQEEEAPPKYVRQASSLSEDPQQQGRNPPRSSSRKRRASAMGVVQ